MSVLASQHGPSPDFVRALYDTPLFALLDRAREVHVAHHASEEVQLCTLLSVKTGGCPEDCAYCPQSSHHATDVGPEKMLDVGEVLAAARRETAPPSIAFCRWCAASRNWGSKRA
jgi:biotin synthase